MRLSCDSMTIDPEERTYRKQVLKDAVISIAWLKFVSIIFYIVLIYFVRTNTEGNVSMAIQIMLLIAIPLQIILGILLFIGALSKSPTLLDTALWLCLALASYNTVLGIFGAVFYIRIGYTPIHFVLVVAFILLAVAFFMVLCHDILIIFAYKQMLLTFPETSPSPAGSSCNMK